MGSERWERIESIFHATLGQPAGQRVIFLRDACGGDEALQHEVEWLLSRESSAADFLESPIAALVANMALSAAPALLGASALGRTSSRSGSARAAWATSTRRMTRDSAATWRLRCSHPPSQMIPSDRAVSSGKRARWRA